MSITQSKTVLKLIIASTILYSIGKYAVGRVRNLKLRNKAKEKLRRKLEFKLNAEDVGIELESFILSLTAGELAKGIRERKFSCVQVMSIYAKRALEIGRNLNLTTEECFEDALREAKLCDEEVEKGVFRGLLHGVPISLKDHFSMKGYQTTYGLSWKLDYTDDETFILIELLKKQGAIPFVRSNVSQGLMWIESKNRVYGQALNPWNTLKTPGGSSGGEGGLIAARASPLGIASDVGGSIRCPCNFCGVYGFVPTPKRVPKAWILGSKVHNVELMGQFLECSYGPIGKCVEDLSLVLQIWLSDELFSLKPEVVPLKFEISKYKSSKSLKVGIFPGHEKFPVAKCIKDAIIKCGQELQTTCEVIQYDFPQLEKLAKLFNLLYGMEGNSGLFEALKGEDPEDYFTLMIFNENHPYLMALLMKVLKLAGQKRLVELYDLSVEASIPGYLQIFQDIEDVVQDTIRGWENLALDCVVCPAFGVVAVSHGQATDVVPCLVYSYIWNMLGFCFGVIPVGIVEKGQAKFEDSFDDILTKACREVMENGEGLPYALQVVGLPYKDEVVLNLMKRIEGIFDFHKYAL